MIQSMTIQCRSCKEILPSSMFHRYADSSTGFRSLCKKCRKKQEQRPEMVIKRMTKASLIIEKLCVSCEKTKGLSEFHSAPANADRHHNSCKKCVYTRRGVGTPEYREGMKLRYVRDWHKRTLNEARIRAKRLNVPFSLELSDIKIPEFCPVLGISLIIGGKMRIPNRPTLDRHIPELGYVAGNVSVICWLANKTKGNLTDPTIFDRIAAYMRSHRK